MIRHFIFTETVAAANSTQAIAVLSPAMSEAATECLLMAVVGLSALVAPSRLTTSLTAVNLPSITV
jgi:hypothetical protein